MSRSSFSTVYFLVLLPVFLVIIVAIKIDDPGPAFFKQKRVGLNKNFFELYKFRSMKVQDPSEEKSEWTTPDDPRKTKVGDFIRKTSIDELPQFFNVLKGDMSVVGPRPALWNQYDLIAERDKYGANDVMPGLTGWAQINGRDELEIDVKAKLDGEYVERQSFCFDVKCFVGTIFSVMEAILARPPIKINALNNAQAIPTISGLMPKAVSNAEPIELDCTILPIKPRARIIATEKNTARNLPKAPLKAAFM